MKFDGYINTDFWNMTWLRRRRGASISSTAWPASTAWTRRSGIAPVVATFDRLMFPNRDRLMRYAEAGLVDPDGPAAALIGYPKVDCLVDGSLDRRAIELDSGSTPTVPTVLYAPTWSPHSSLATMGEAIIAALAGLDVNVIVKLHDRSFDPVATGAGGVDWRTRIAGSCRNRASTSQRRTSRHTCSPPTRW